MLRSEAKIKITEGNLSTNQKLIETNVLALEEGAELLIVLKNNQYTEGYKPAFHSTIGAHFRHVLEHYRCFLRQYESLQFCYDKRDRDLPLESDVEYAKSTINELIVGLKKISSLAFEKRYSIIDEQSDGPIETNLQRELLFLQSHTVHHYAIIGAMTRAFGNQTDDEFGVAIATRTHNKKQIDTKPGEPTPCAQ